MLTFAYLALNPNGRSIEAELQANSWDEAIVKIRAQGYMPMQIQEKARGLSQGHFRSVGQSVNWPEAMERRKARLQFVARPLIATMGASRPADPNDETERLMRVNLGRVKLNLAYRE